MNKPNRTDASAALEVIKAYAREYCTNPTFRDDVDEAHLISAGLSTLIGHDTELSLSIAARLAEDVNYHDLAKTIRSS